jgi:hypothetical protein
MLTSLYIPFTDFVINDLDGQKILYENLVQSGPSYRLIVHDSPAWWEIRDKMCFSEGLRIISEKEAAHYIEISKKFFSPITEAAPYYEIKGQRFPMSNLTTDLRRALLYILIAHDHGARIYEDDILRLDSSVVEILKRNSETFSQEALSRAEFVEKLLAGYQRDSINTLSVNCDARIFSDLMKLLENEEIKELSSLNYLFGKLNVEKNWIKREIKQKLTEIVQNSKFEYLVKGVALGLSYHPDLESVGKILMFLSEVGAKILSRFDLKEYSPPIEDPQLFKYANLNGINTFSYKPFDYDLSFFH